MCLFLVDLYEKSDTPIALKVGSVICPFVLKELSGFGTEGLTKKSGPIDISPHLQVMSPKMQSLTETNVDMQIDRKSVV